MKPAIMYTEISHTAVLKKCNYIKFKNAETSGGKNRCGKYSPPVSG